MIYSPLQITDIRLWLDGQDLATLFQDTARTSAVTANGQSVKGWADKGGANLHASEATNAPTYDEDGINGLPCLDFNGTNQKLLSTGVFAAANDRALSVYLVSSGGDGTNRVPLGSADGRWYIERNGTNNLRKWTLTGVTPASVSTSMNLVGTSTDASIDGMGYDGAVVRDQRVTDSTRLVLYTGLGKRYTPATGALGLSGNLTIGNYAGAFWWLGKIGEAIIINRGLTDGEDADLTGYLADKWEIGNQSYVLCCGDSLTSGQGLTATQTYPYQLQQLIEAGYLVDTDAYGGRNIYQAMPEMYRTVLFRSWPQVSTQVAVVFFGANDLSSRTAEVFAAEYQRYCELLVAKGFRIIACTVLPRAGAAAEFEARRQTFNAWLRTNRGLFSALVDLASDPRIGDAGDNTGNTYYQADDIHLTEAGAGIVAGLVAPHVVNVIGAVPEMRVLRGRWR